VLDETQSVTVWEYKLVSMGNPLEPDVETRANAFGSQGWELAAIEAGVWVFKRPRVGEEPTSEPLRAIIEQSVPLVEVEVEPTLLAVPGSPAAPTAKGE